MAHYSSQLLYQEDELKNSLRGISVKPLVSASYAQFGVNAGDEESWATRNGIRIPTHYSWRPILVEKSIRTSTDDFTTKLDRTCIVAKAMCSVACLE